MQIVIDSWFEIDNSLFNYTHMIVISLMSISSCSSESIETVEKLQQLLITKGSNESEVMQLLEDPTLVKHLMSPTDEKVCTYIY